MSGSITSLRESVGPYRSRVLWFAAVAMVVLGAGTVVAALLDWRQVALAGLATLLTGMAALLLVVFRRVGVVLRTLREHDSRLAVHQQEVERGRSATQQATQACDALHADLLGSEGRLISLERRLLAEVGALDEVLDAMSSSLEDVKKSVRAGRDSVAAQAPAIDSLSSTLDKVGTSVRAGRDSVEQVRATQERAMTKLDRVLAGVRASAAGSFDAPARIAPHSQPETLDLGE